MEVSELKARILELLKTDEEFRYAVAGLLGLEEVLREVRALQEQVADNSRAIRALQEQVRGLQEQVRGLQEQVLRLQEQVVENTKAIRELREDMNKLREDMNRAFKRYDEELARLRKDMNEGFQLIRRHIDALGARWGILAEEAFRAGVAGIVERYFGGRVERWAHYDEEGFVFGRPTVVEVDMIVRDREHVLVEIKSTVSRADVFELWRIGQLYERVRGVKPRLAIVSPFVRDEAKKVAKELGIEVITAF